MVHHKESPRKREYDMASSPHFHTKPPHLALPPPAFSSKNIQTPPYPSILKRQPPPPVYDGGVGVIEVG